MVTAAATVPSSQRSLRQPRQIAHTSRTSACSKSSATDRRTRRDAGPGRRPRSRSRHRLDQAGRDRGHDRSLAATTTRRPPDMERLAASRSLSQVMDALTDLFASAAASSASIVIVGTPGGASALLNDRPTPGSAGSR